MKKTGGALKKDVIGRGPGELLEPTRRKGQRQTGIYHWNRKKRESRRARISLEGGGGGGSQNISTRGAEKALENKKKKNGLRDEYKGWGIKRHLLPGQKQDCCGQRCELSEGGELVMKPRLT